MPSDRYSDGSTKRNDSCVGAGRSDDQVGRQGLHKGEKRDRLAIYIAGAWDGPPVHGQPPLVQFINAIDRQTHQNRAEAGMAASASPTPT